VRTTSYDTSKTRGYLKSFGVSVTMYEEEMLELIERAGSEDPGKILSEALKLTENVNRRVLEIVEHVLNAEVELMRMLAEKLSDRGGKGSRGP